MINESMNKDEALTEAVGVQTVAKSFEEMGVVAPDESLQMASEFLDQLKIESPGAADLTIKAANVWKLVEEQVDRDQLNVLYRSSRNIVSTSKGREFMRLLPEILEDEKLVLDKTKQLFRNNQELNKVLDSKPGLSDLWYEHLYMTFKMTEAVIRSDLPGEYP